MGSIVLALPTAGANWFDAAALAVLLLFAWQGYRRGALGCIAGIATTVLAIAGAFLLAPAVGSALIGHWDLARPLAERIAFLILVFALRFLFGWVMGELVGALRAVLRAIPPLDFADHLLGVIPSLVAGTLVILVVLVAALLLPIDRRVHAAAAHSYVGRLATAEAARAGQAIHQSGLLSAPERILDVERALSAIQSVRDLGAPS